MQLIPRACLLVMAREPAVAWLNRLPGRELGEPEFDLSSANAQPTATLIAPVGDEAELEAELGRVWKDIFEEWLGLWCEDRLLWPQGRNFEMFADWFQIAVSPIVFDAVGEGGEASEPPKSKIIMP